MDAYDGVAVGSDAPADFYIRHVPSKMAFKKVLDSYHPEKGWNSNSKVWVSLGSDLGHIRGCSTRMALGRMQPQPELSSMGYCLAGGGGDSTNYLVYRAQQSGKISLDLSVCQKTNEIEWFDPRTGQLLAGGQIQGGQVLALRAPFEGNAVVYVHASQCGSQR